jgi:spore photoproduct lyase
MIIYLEKKYKDNQIAKNIINFYKNSQILEIDNYKNIFDKNISGNIEESIIIAWVNNAILEAPIWYWHPWIWYFFKNSINCIYDCKYCYLKWAFKNDMKVFFVNYDEIKSQILEKVSERKWNETIWFYSSDYSDNLWTDNFTNFTSEFIPFFDTLDNVKMEIRTKSINIKNLLSLKTSKNIEIAFSLNPSEVISKYELKTPWLDLRIKAINTLIDAWWQVWIRFLPLLEIENYKEIYENFLTDITKKIDFSKVSSIFIWWLLYTKDDYNKILKKEPYLDLLYKLEDSKDSFIREKRDVRDYFYNLFDKLLKDQKCNRCLDD